MTGSTTALIVMPIVVSLALFSWIAAVFYANSHPGPGRASDELRTEVRGGSFQAVEGGRQLMPIPEHRPAAPGQRPPDASEEYRVPSGSATATATSAEADIRSAEEDTHPMATPPPR